MGFSQTFVMSNKVRELRAQGHSVISLTLGEPDFNVPDDIKEAAKTAIDENYSHYSPVPGFLDVREAVCHKLKRDNGLDYSPKQICITNGAKQAILNVLTAVLDEGDEVILPAPFWVSYEEMVKLMGGQPVIIQGSKNNGNKITAEQLAAAITPKTKVILYSSPCNPSGSYFTKEELETFAKVIVRHPQITVISDEIYEYINYDGQHYSIAQIDNVREQVAVINGMSKGYAMTGWRIGYSACPEWLASACEKVQGQMTSGPNTVAQRAAWHALRQDPQQYAFMVKSFKKRRDLAFTLMKQIPGFKVELPPAAFFLFPDVSYYLGKKINGELMRTADDFAMFLLTNAYVGTVGGDSFGDEHCLRFSYAASEDDLTEALGRIKHLLETATIE